MEQKKPKTLETIRDQEDMAIVKMWATVLITGPLLLYFNSKLADGIYTDLDVTVIFSAILFTGVMFLKETTNFKK
jgi:hypothetical protein